jgi:hypothetical protein
MRRESWGSLSVTGFLAGAIPVAALSLPRYLQGYSSGYNWHGRYVEFYVKGVPTVYAWQAYAENIASYGLHGLIGAVVFFAVWRRLHAP